MSELATGPALPSYPYKIAVLCDLRDASGNLLLLRRIKDPNKGLYSPIGGKLDTGLGESPARCAQREIEEEAGIHVPIDRLHLGGIISEHGYQGQTNWLMFWYRVIGAVTVEPRTIREGDLEWHPIDGINALDLPDTDRSIIWPLVLEHDAPRHEPDSRPGFFAVHLECVGPKLTWEVQQSTRRA